MRARAASDIAAVTHPCGDESIRHGENKRSDENSDETECDKTADHTCEYEQKG